MSKPPSIEEVLETFRGKLTAEQCKVLLAKDFPRVEDLHQEDSYLEFMGLIKEWAVFAKESTVGKLALIVLYAGNAISSLDAIERLSPITFEQGIEYLRVASSNCSIPATFFKLCRALPTAGDAVPLPTPVTILDKNYYAEWKIYNETTTTRPREPQPIALYPGDRIFPYAPEWD